MLFPRTFKSAAALFLVTVGFAAPVHAQQNKPITSGTWYEDRANVIAASSTIVNLSFAQTPANQFLNITNVSCTVNVETSQAITTINLNAGTTSGATDLGRYYPLKGSATAETISGGKYYSVIQNGMFYKFGPGRFPSIAVSIDPNGAPGISASCVIVGNLTEN